MKKLYRKSTVHPTQSVVSDHLLSFLPAAILTLTVALSPGDREVLAYLLSCTSPVFSDGNRRSRGGGSKGGGGGSGADDHPPCFNCSCFRCYLSYWAKWDGSPNRQLIHEIIDAFEDSLLKESKKEKNRRDRRKGKSVRANIGLGLDGCSNKSSELSLAVEDSNFGESNAPSEGFGAETTGGGGGSGGEEDDSVVEEDFDKGSVRRFVSFLGERIWGVWG